MNQKKIIENYQTGEIYFQTKPEVRKLIRRKVYCIVGSKTWTNVGFQIYKEVRKNIISSSLFL
jgi:hypothetical protein